ncbi:hypothetical protein [uncultured Cohaesibacter sp.]|uniref:hypothetical protein n=1 Tax=uncultured Cohaesibacter sp. TaxID=1002546 RepID=UPI002AA69B25|nr:hypothetical protein [uncultured Cohaesibacter sp.]
MSAEGRPVEAAKTSADAVPVRFAQIGSVSAQTIALPSAVLRSSAIELMGSGIGSITLDKLVHR